MRTLCDAYHIIRNLNFISIQLWTYLSIWHKICFYYMSSHIICYDLRKLNSVYGTNTVCRQIISEIIFVLSKVKPWSQGWLIAAGAYPGFCSIQRLEVFLLPMDKMLVHRRLLPCDFVTCRFPQQFAGTHLYTWVERGTESKVSSPTTQHNVPARAWTRTARSGVEHTNHEATASPTFSW